MSLWLYGDKRNGRRSLYSAGPDPFHFGMLAIPLVPPVLMLVLPIIRFLLDLLP